MARKVKALLQNDNAGKNRRHREHRSKNGRKKKDAGKLVFKNWWHTKGKRKADKHQKKLLREVEVGEAYNVTANVHDNIPFV